MGECNFEKIRVLIVDDSAKHTLGGPSIVIPFETEAGPFVLNVCIGGT